MLDNSNSLHNAEAMTRLESYIEKRAPHEKEIVRIERKLEQHLSREEARETAARIYDLAFDVDEEINRILSDPKVTQLYEYDGLFFNPRGKTGFHRAFSGFNVLHSLNNQKIDLFFSHRDKDSALKWLMDELETHRWEATVRRMNWEDEGSLSCLTREVIDAIMADVRERRRKAKEESASVLSPEEKAFFQSYEQALRG
jgi:hypothetical protein